MNVFLCSIESEEELRNVIRNNHTFVESYKQARNCHWKYQNNHTDGCKNREEVISYYLQVFFLLLNNFIM